VSEDTQQTRGDDRGYRGQGGWVTTRVAAKALGVKPRQVRNYIAEGELEYRTEGNGVNKTYFVSINSVNELREKRNSAGIKPRKDREVSSGALDATATAEMLEGFSARLEARAMEIGELKARLELTSQTESTLREQLQRERERAERLEGQLEEGNRSWWRRFFGFR
jgi:DNA-binding transcriptional MerR regulator